MTCIAWDGHTLAADSRLSSGTTITDDNFNKLHVFKKTITYGGDKLLAIAWCGAACDVDKVMCYIYSDDFPSDTEVKHDVCAIIVGSKAVYVLEPESSFLIRHKRKTLIAEGSGGRVALSALKLGLTSVDAVKHAIKMDIACGGKVRSVSL